MIKTLFEIVEDRKRHPVKGSYTNQLLDEGYEKAAQKLGEEAIELIVAAGHQGHQRVIEEAADLIYHLAVLLVQQGVTLADIESELEKRHKE